MSIIQSFFSVNTADIQKLIIHYDIYSVTSILKTQLKLYDIIKR